jgi:hypothetical protein
MTPFDKLTWGDPMYAQIAGSDAQAYATDPTSGAIMSMSSGPEQAPSAMLSYVSGENQPAQQAAASEDCNCDNVSEFAVWSPCWWQCINPFSKAGNAADQQHVVQPIKQSTGIDLNQIVVKVIIAALALGLLFIGVKEIAEA